MFDEDDWRLNDRRGRVMSVMADVIQMDKESLRGCGSFSFTVCRL